MTTARAVTKAPVERYSRQAALESLRSRDPTFSPSETAELLARTDNEHLLGYVFEEAFTHVFPGDTNDYPSEQFFNDLNEELTNAPSFHLWAEIPLCRYRCHFCQFPILLVNRDKDHTAERAKRWVDANIAEARMWFEAVPALRDTPVGEFCLFGGTPTAIPMPELQRLVEFYTANFNFDANTSLRAEGSPDTLVAETLSALRAMNFTSLTYGIQSFDDALLKLANRRHTGKQASSAIRLARELGFERVDGDLVWGLPGQSVASFISDVEQMIKLDFSTIVIAKLHLRPFDEVGSAIGNVLPTPWQNPKFREKIANQGNRWPSLGEQYQMREAGTKLLRDAGYYEHPTTYFPKREMGAQRWRALNLDHDKQYPQVGIGLGGYTWTARSQANVANDPQRYLAAIDAGELPLENLTGISDDGREARAVRMALSTCQPLTDEVHQTLFDGSSLLNGKWASVFGDLEHRGLARVDRDTRSVALTPVGQTLVEAIMHTEIR